VDERGDESIEAPIDPPRSLDHRNHPINANAKPPHAFNVNPGARHAHPVREVSARKGFTAREHAFVTMQPG
jgi:hypothetical protein